MLKQSKQGEIGERWVQRESASQTEYRRGFKKEILQEEPCKMLLVFT